MDSLNVFQRMIGRMVFGKRWSLTNPDPSWTGSGRSITGISVSEQKSLRLSAVFACVRVLAETIASLPIHVYRTSDKGRTRMMDHPVSRLFRRKVNPEITPYVFQNLATASCTLWGNHYSQIRRDQGGRPIELWPLQSWAMTITRDKSSNELLYQYDDGVTRKTFSKESILHLKILSLDGLTGLSPIGYARETVGLGLAEQEYGARYFGNGTNVGAVVSHPKQMTPGAYNRLKESIQEKYEGLGKSHKVMVLEEGMKFEKNTISPSDSQFLESRKFTVNEICRIFRVPPHLVADLDRATFSNIEQQSLEFMVYSILPWLTNIEQEINLKLFGEKESEEYYVKFMVNQLLRGDTASRFAAYKSGRDGGWLSVNDIRELEEHNRIDGGDEYLAPLNMIPGQLATDYFQSIIDSKKGGNTNAGK